MSEKDKDLVVNIDENALPEAKLDNGKMVIKKGDFDRIKNVIDQADASQSTDCSEKESVEEKKDAKPIKRYKKKRGFELSPEVQNKVVALLKKNEMLSKESTKEANKKIEENEEEIVDTLLKISTYFTSPKGIKSEEMSPMESARSYKLALLRAGVEKEFVCALENSIFDLQSEKAVQYSWNAVKIIEDILKAKAEAANKKSKNKKSKTPLYVYENAEFKKIDEKYKTQINFSKYRKVEPNNKKDFIELLEKDLKFDKLYVLEDELLKDVSEKLNWNIEIIQYLWKRMKGRAFGVSVSGVPNRIVKITPNPMERCLSAEKAAKIMADGDKLNLKYENGEISIVGIKP